MSAPNRILLGTRKGLVTLERQGGGYRVDTVDHRGVPVLYAAQLRDGSRWASLEMGHWGPKLSRSGDGGKSWTEVPAPQYPEATGASLTAVWTIADGHERTPGRVWLGTFPGGLFMSDDGGMTFELNEPLWAKKEAAGWFGGGRDLPGVHSVVTDVRDQDHVWVGVSCGGVYETDDGGASWVPRNVGLPADFLPDPNVEAGHDPHCIVQVAGAPDVLWQQNHSGIERSVDGAQRWDEVSQSDGPARFGFAVVAHDTDPDVAWVVPATSDEERSAVADSMVVCRTEDGGRSWLQLRDGLPQEAAFDLVYRHALDRRGDELAFGSTTGNLFWSGDGGDSWRCLGNHFAPIYSVRFA